MHKSFCLPVGDVLARDEGVRDRDEISRLATSTTLLCERIVAMKRMRFRNPHVCVIVRHVIIWIFDGDPTTFVPP